MFYITFTHLAELLALGGRRSACERAAVARLRRERAQEYVDYTQHFRCKSDL